MIRNMHLAAAAAIFLLGLALVVRSVAAHGTIVLSGHVVAGAAFIIYGAVRCYYLRGVK